MGPGVSIHFGPQRSELFSLYLHLLIFFPLNSCLILEPKHKETLSILGYIFHFLSCFFETVSYYIALVDLKLTT